MRIKRFSYKNKATGWELAPMEFGDFNLLVGVSGVGKSKILEAIETLRKILIESVTYVGISWEIELSIDRVDYQWVVEVEDAVRPNLPWIKKETLKGGDVDFERILSQTVINGSVLPVQLNPYQSMLTLFQQDERIKPIFDGFKNMEILVMPQSMMPQTFESNESEVIRSFTSLEAIQNSDYPIHTKLIMARLNLPDIFEQIKEDYISLFPRVHGFGISKTVMGEIGSSSDKPFPNASQLEFSLQETGVDIQIRQPDISTGMLKTLLIIGAIYLSPPGSIILIDEFENSLGVNCIDIFEQIPYESYDLQFIITSHHPYIINNVPMVDWKIVTRKGSVVTVKSATDFNLGKSKHTAFKQLLQLDEFNEGITLP